MPGQINSREAWNFKISDENVDALRFAIEDLKEWFKVVLGLQKI